MKVIDPETVTIYNFPNAHWVNWGAGGARGEHCLKTAKDGDIVAIVPSNWIVSAKGDVSIYSTGPREQTLNECLRFVSERMRSSDYLGGCLLKKIKAALQDFNGSTRAWK